jgi:SNF2 family DNA or RNA helicase
MSSFALDLTSLLPLPKKKGGAVKKKAVTKKKEKAVTKKKEKAVTKKKEKAVTETKAKGEEEEMLPHKLTEYQQRVGRKVVSLVTKGSYRSAPDLPPSRRGVVVAHVPGSGKTGGLLCALLRLRLRRAKGISAEHGRTRGRALIVVPSSTVDHWKAEAEMWCGDRLRAWVLNPKKTSARTWPDLMKAAGDAEIIIMSHAMTRSVGGPCCFRVVVVDEAHYLRNHSGSKKDRRKKGIKTGAAVQSLCDRSKAVVLMTGTPYNNGAGDMRAYAKLMDPKSVYASASMWRSRDRTVVTDPKDPRMIWKRQYVDVVTGEEAHKDLPSRSTEVITVDMNEAEETQQRLLAGRLGREIKDREVRTVNEKGKDTMTAVLLTLLRLRQSVCASWLVKDGEEGGGIVRPDSAAMLRRTSSKLAAMLAAVRELTKEGRRVVIFCEWVEWLKAAKIVLEDDGISCVECHGGVDAEKRRTALAQFTPTRGAAVASVGGDEPESADVLLLTRQSGGVGLNLQLASAVIVCNLWFNPFADAQAEDRVHRKGQTRDVRVIRLVTKRSVEEWVLAIQLRKTEGSWLYHSPFGKEREWEAAAHEASKAYGSSDKSFALRDLKELLAVYLGDLNKVRGRVPKLRKKDGRESKFWADLPVVDVHRPSVQVVKGTKRAMDGNGDSIVPSKRVKVQ